MAKAKETINYEDYISKNIHVSYTNHTPSMRKQLDGSKTEYGTSTLPFAWITMSHTSNRNIVYKQSEGQEYLLGDGGTVKEVRGCNPGYLEIYLNYSDKYGQSGNIPSKLTIGNSDIKPFANISCLLGSTTYASSCVYNFSSQVTHFTINSSEFRMPYKDNPMNTAYNVGSNTPHIAVTPYQVDNMPTLDPFKIWETGDCYAYMQSVYAEYIVPYTTTSAKRTCDGYPNWYNVLISDNLDDCHSYINTGVIPDSAHLNPMDDDYSQPTGDDNGYDDGHEDGSSGHNTDDHKPSQPVSSALNFESANIYSISKSQLDAFIQWFYTSDILSVLDNYVSGRYNNLSSCVLQLMDMPVSDNYLGTKSESTIVVGSVNTTLGAQAVSGTAPLVTVGYIDITEHYGSYLDYAPYTDLSLYLPYVGFFDLDTNIFMGTKLLVQAMFDIITGKITYFILSDNVTIHIKEAMIATQLEFTLEDAVAFRGAQLQSLANKAISTTTMVATGNVGALPSLMGGVQPPHMMVGGQASDSSGLYSPQKCYILRKIPSYNRPSNYKSKVGYPLFKHHTLSDISGFTKCLNPQIEIDHATKIEIDMIEDLLTKGVII